MRQLRSITLAITLASATGLAARALGRVRVQSASPPLALSPLGRLPASWRGDLASASDTTRWQVDLLSDGTFQLRQTFLDRPAPNRFDDIGRWRIEPGSNRLVLRGGREAPLFFQPIEGGAALATLDLHGERLRSDQPHRLQRLATPQPIDPRLHLVGMFRDQANVTNIQLCATGARLPVATEADYRRLKQSYLKAQPAGRTGQPMLVNLEGLITNRPSSDPNRPPQRTLVVDRFVTVHPGQGCPQPNASPAPAPAPRAMASPSLRGTVTFAFARGIVRVNNAEYDGAATGFTRIVLVDTDQPANSATCFSIPGIPIPAAARTRPRPNGVLARCWTAVMDRLPPFPVSRPHPFIPHASWLIRPRSLVPRRTFLLLKRRTASRLHTGWTCSRRRGRGSTWNSSRS